jgi:hypothetical protein
LKIRISASIEKSLRDRLYDEVYETYHGFKGGLSAIIETAIASYLEDKTHKIAHKNLAPGLSKVERTIDAIFRSLRDNGFNRSFSQSEFEFACSKVAGSDKRTVQKYLRWAQKLGHIKHRAGVIWDFVVTGSEEATGA